MSYTQFYTWLGTKRAWNYKMILSNNIESEEEKNLTIRYILETYGPVPCSQHKTRVGVRSYVVNQAPDVYPVWDPVTKQLSLLFRRKGFGYCQKIATDHPAVRELNKQKNLVAAKKFAPTGLQQ